jgi:hypothetical protein
LTFLLELAHLAKTAIVAGLTSPAAELVSSYELFLPILVHLHLVRHDAAHVPVLLPVLDIRNAEGRPIEVSQVVLDE